MRKRSRYRPKGVLLNPVAYVVEGLQPVERHGSHLLDLKIKNHAAMTTLTRGQAVKADVDRLIVMVNMVEALYRLGFGREYEDVVKQGLDALWAVARRGAESGRFILKAEEMAALNLVMELHDAQMSIISVKDMEKACQLIEQERRQRRMKPIVERV